MNPGSDYTAMVRELFDCLRNANVRLASGDITEARICVAEARAIHGELDRIARNVDPGGVGAIFLNVVAERINSLDDLVDSMASK